MAKLAANSQQRGSDDDTERKMTLLQQLLEEVCKRRVDARAWGEVKILMTWTDGRLKEFRIVDEQIVKDALEVKDTGVRIS